MKQSFIVIHLMPDAVNSLPFSIEITPCLDPGYCLQKSAKSKHTLEEEEEESALSKYMSRTLTLPINTFSGVIH